MRFKRRLMISSPMRAQTKKTKSARQTPIAVLRIVASLMLKSYVASVLVAEAVAFVADEAKSEVILDIVGSC